MQGIIVITKKRNIKKKVYDKCIREQQMKLIDFI